jgi:molybdopterin converting factor small subunit
MKLTILYFASLREALGLDRETVEIPSQVKTVGDLRTIFRAFCK